MAGVCLVHGKYGIRLVWDNPMKASGYQSPGEPGGLLFGFFLVQENSTVLGFECTMLREKEV